MDDPNTPVPSQPPACWSCWFQIRVGEQHFNELNTAPVQVAKDIDVDGTPVMPNQAGKSALKMEAIFWTIYPAW